MNQDQKKYLLRRIEEIKLTKIQSLSNSVPDIDIIKLLKKLQPRKDFQSIFDKHIAEVIKDCLESKKLPRTYTNYNRDIFYTESQLFSNFSTISKLYTELSYKHQIKIDKKKQEINKYVVKLKDSIMLGEATEALEQLAEFEKMKF